MSLMQMKNEEKGRHVFEEATELIQYQKFIDDKYSLWDKKIFYFLCLLHF